MSSALSTLLFIVSNSKIIQKNDCDLSDHSLLFLQLSVESCLLTLLLNPIFTGPGVVDVAQIIKRINMNSVLFN